MATNFLAWSHSRIKQFRDCPKQLYHNAVAPKNSAERLVFVQSQAMLDGNEVDNALTSRISINTPLPAKFTPYEPIAQSVCAAPGAKFTQLQLALDQTFKPCGYKDWDHAWVRVVYDMAIIDRDHAFIWDWKNGQIWLDEEQLRLFAAVGFHVYPEVDVIDVSYVWLRHGITTDATYRRRELPEMWQTFLPDVERMQVAYKTNHWPAEPARGKATCKYCPVNAAKKCDKAQGLYEGK